jgi:hypothetical protein
MYLTLCKNVFPVGLWYSDIVSIDVDLSVQIFQSHTTVVIRQDVVVPEVYNRKL